MTETCLLVMRWAAQRWHEHCPGIHTERGTYGLLLRENAKQGNCEAQSTNTAIGAERLVVVLKVSERKHERRSRSIRQSEQVNLGLRRSL